MVQFRGYLRDTLTIRHQLAGATGLVGYGLNAELFSKTFWTFSLWKSRERIEAFAHDNPHRRIIQRLRPLMAEVRFAFVPVSGREFPWTSGHMKAPVEED